MKAKRHGGKGGVISTWQRRAVVGRTLRPDGPEDCSGALLGQSM